MPDSPQTRSQLQAALQDNVQGLISASTIRFLVDSVPLNTDSPLLYDVAGSSATVQSSVDALATTVAAKAAQSDLQALSGTVTAQATTLAGKAAQSDLVALTSTVTTQGTALASLTGTVTAQGTALAGKANTSDLSALTGTVTTLGTTVSGKAARSDLAALTTTVASQGTAVSAATTNLGTLGTSVTAHVAATAAHGVTGSILGSTDYQKVTNKIFVPALVTMVSSSTIATDASMGNNFRFVATSSFTLANPTNGSDGQTMTWEIVQDSTGGRTISFGSAFAFGTDLPNNLALSTTASATDFLTARFNSSASKWRVVGFSRGY